MTDTFDQPDAFMPLSLKARLGRAAAWRTRWPSVTPIARPASDLPLLILPPELMGIGRVASAVAAQFGSPIWLAQADVRLGRSPAATLAWVAPIDLVALTAPHRPTLATGDLSAFAPSPLTISADDHPVTALAYLLHVVGVAEAPTTPATLPAPLVDLLDRCGQEVPASDNPAKQVALQIHERIPIFCADAIDTGIAEDWVMRLHWLAETAALTLDGPALARGAVLTRLPRYWPNTACFVTFQADGESDSNALLTASLDLLRRRRFAVLPVAVPDALDLVHRTTYLLELGEWVALYVAMLSNSELGGRVPHAILFAP